MLGIQFMKAPPTHCVIHIRNGRIVREGVGLSFFYHAPTSGIMLIPAVSQDVPFAFHETTSDFQTVTVQGTLTGKIDDVKQMAGMLDFTVDNRGRITGDGPEVLKQRLLGITQVLTRHSVQRLGLREALANPDVVGDEVTRGLQESQAISSLGVRVLALSIQGVRPTPETARALEAEAREALLKKADEALYERRNAAVLQERIIRESELQTELAVEAKQRQIREAKMAADIAVEEQRAALITQKAENDKHEADVRAYALATTLEPVRDIDWRTLMAVGAGSTDSRTMIALAFRELAENAQKIGVLNVTPDLLTSLLKK